MFNEVPSWAKIVAAVVAVIIVLAILGPIISYLVKLIFGAVIAVLILGAGYYVLKKLKA